MDILFAWLVIEIQSYYTILFELEFLQFRRYYMVNYKNMFQMKDVSVCRQWNCPETMELYITLQSQSEVMSCIKEIELLNMFEGKFGAEGQLGLPLNKWNPLSACFLWLPFHWWNKWAFIMRQLAHSFLGRDKLEPCYDFSIKLIDRSQFWSRSTAVQCTCS